MKSKIGIIRGASEKKVKSKKFNIYLGISLHNKWFTKNNMKESILWGLKHTKKRFGLVIADTLQAINYENKDKYSKKSALKKALKEGEKIHEILKEILFELPKQDREKIDIIHWEDVKKDPFFKKTLNFFLKEFNKNGEFKKEIINITYNFVKSTGEKNTSKEKLEKLSAYILNELPELIQGFYYNNTDYNRFIYPNDNILSQFIEKIQKKELFPEFYNKLDIKKNVFVELKVLK